MKSNALCALALAWLAAAASASTNVPPPPQSQPLLITGATLHTMTGAPIVDGRMLIDKGRIAAIGDAASVPDVPGASTLALPGKHVYPGFIAANSALGLVEVSAVRATLDATEPGTINANARAIVAVNADSELIPVARANGVLAALSVPRAGPAGLIGGTSALIQLDGWTWEDMALLPEAALHVFLPSLRNPAAQYPQLPAARLEEMQRNTRNRLRSLEDTFDTAKAYADQRASGELPLADARLEAMRPVFSGQRQVFMHADDAAQIRYALHFAQRYGLRMVIVGGMDAPLLAPLLKAANVPVILAGVHRLPLRRGDAPDAPFAAAAKLHAAGVTVVIARGGTPFDAARERSLPFEAATAAAHGLPRDVALRSITLSAAEVLGVGDRLGSLEKGKLASFFVTDGDPLEIVTQVERVFIQGRELPLVDKQTQLRDKYTERYRQLRAAGR
jgi:imidazolonepropionase-like amidohydrolase